LLGSPYSEAVNPVSVSFHLEGEDIMKVYEEWRDKAEETQMGGMCCDCRWVLIFGGDCPKCGSDDIQCGRYPVDAFDNDVENEWQKFRRNCPDVAKENEDMQPGEKE
jgi:hypothetical protein